ncbi:hypothetical protein H2203_003870 [Taxawa tesnikishii (nom. ined.)]|nr:hypothetical protein H2203_003870 [Dothideales sp. JES 119]
MHLTAVASSVLLCAVAAATPLNDPWPITQANVNDLTMCANKSPIIPQIVNDLCASEGFLIPSEHAANGWTDPANKYHITIQDDGCKGQWVPQHWCKIQFWQACAMGDWDGSGEWLFGDNDCQRFTIRKL